MQSTSVNLGELSRLAAGSVPRLQVITSAKGMGPYPFLSPPSFSMNATNNNSSPNQRRAVVPPTASFQQAMLGGNAPSSSLPPFTTKISDLPKNPKEFIATLLQLKTDLQEEQHNVELKDAEIIKLRKQLEVINEDHRNDIARLKEGHNIETYKLMKEIERINRDHVDTHSTFQEKLASTKEKHNYSLSDVETTYEKKLATLEELYTSKITDLNAKNEEGHRIVATLQAQLSEVENRAMYMQQEIEVRKRDQYSLDVHNSELTSQLNDSRIKLRDLHEIFSSVQSVTAELSKKYDDTNIEYHRVVADNKRYELQLYDMNNMLQDAHHTLQATTTHKDGVISKLQEQLAVAELFMHRIHTAMVQKRGEKSAVEEEIEKFHVSVSSSSSSSINIPLKAVPTSLLTSPSKPFTYQSVIGNSWPVNVNSSPPYQQHEQQQSVTTPVYHTPQPLNQMHTPMNNAPLFPQYQQQQSVAAAVSNATQPLLKVHAPVNNGPQYQQQQSVSAPVNTNSRPTQQQQQVLPGDKKPAESREEAEAVAKEAIRQREMEEERQQQREMEEERQRVIAEMERLKAEEQQKKIQAAREKEQATRDKERRKTQIEMKKQEASLKKQQEELDKMKKEKVIKDKTAELEESMDEKLRLETFMEEWKENFVAINGREPTGDEKPPEIQDFTTQIKLIKTEIKKLNSEIFRLGSS